MKKLNCIIFILIILLFGCDKKSCFFEDNTFYSSVYTEGDKKEMVISSLKYSDTKRLFNSMNINAQDVTGKWKDKGYKYCVKVCDNLLLFPQYLDYQNSICFMKNEKIYTITFDLSTKSSTAKKKVKKNRFGIKHNAVSYIINEIEIDFFFTYAGVYIEIENIHDKIDFYLNTFDFSIELSDNRERYFLFNNIVDNSNELLLYNDLSDIKIINDTDLYKKFEINNFKDGFTSFYFDLYEKKVILDNTVSGEENQPVLSNFTTLRNGTFHVFRVNLNDKLGDESNIKNKFLYVKNIGNIKCKDIYIREVLGPWRSTEISLFNIPLLSEEKIYPVIDKNNYLVFDLSKLKISGYGFAFCSDSENIEIPTTDNSLYPYLIELEFD